MEHISAQYVFYPANIWLSVRTVSSNLKKGMEVWILNSSKRRIFPGHGCSTTRGGWQTRKMRYDISRVQTRQKCFTSDAALLPLFLFGSTVDYQHGVGNDSVSGHTVPVGKADTRYSVSFFFGCAATGIRTFPAFYRKFLVYVQRIFPVST